MLGIGGQEARHGCDFGLFFACEQGETPPELLRAGIYHEIAVPLKGGAWREASMVMLAKALRSKAIGDEDGPVSKPKPLVHRSNTSSTMVHVKATANKEQANA